VPGLRHLSAVRGSPLLRSILILLALAASSLGLVRLTNSQSAPVAPVRKSQPPVSPTNLPYRLVLSAEAAEISIAADPQPPLNQAAGTLTTDSKNPVISLIIRWKTPLSAGEQRFAKLILDPPGKPTITHVFDSSGDIDDILELP
jgi:hypothetical protein